MRRGYETPKAYRPMALLNRTGQTSDAYYVPMHSGGRLVRTTTMQTPPQDAKHSIMRLSLHLALARNSASVPSSLDETQVASNGGYSRKGRELFIAEEAWVVQSEVLGYCTPRRTVIGIKKEKKKGRAKQQNRLMSSVFRELLHYPRGFVTFIIAIITIRKQRSLRSNPRWRL